MHSRSTGDNRNNWLPLRIGLHHLRSRLHLDRSHAPSASNTLAAAGLSGHNDVAGAARALGDLAARGDDLGRGGSLHALRMR